MLGELTCSPTLVSADEVNAPAESTLQTVVVTARKLADAVPDEEVTKRVETALQNDAYFYGEHVTVTTVNGVVHLQGLVYDSSDMLAARRISKRVAGAKRVVNELEISASGMD